MFKSHCMQRGRASLLTLLLTGCAVGPDYQTPAIPDAANDTFTIESAGADGGQQPPVRWWRLYEDDTLDALVQQALIANTDLRVAEANLARARAIFQEVDSSRYPATEIGVGANYGRDETTWPGPGNAPKQWSYSGSVGIAYEVDLFGRVRRDIQAAQADIEAVAAARDAVRLAVVAETTRAYIDTCSLGESIEVAESSVQLAHHSLQLISEREKVGAAMRLDVERAAASRARAEAALAPLHGQRQNRLLELAALLGHVPSGTPESARQCRHIPEFAGTVPVGNGAQLLRRRPDIHAAERELAANTARIGIAVANLYPKVTLGASANYLRNDTLQGDRTWSFGVGPLISWSFPNQMAVRAQIRQAEAQSAASLASFDGAVLTALKEAEQALANYGATLNQRTALAETRSHANNAYNLALQRYQAGVIGYLDALVAQVALIDAEAELIAAEQRLGSQRVTVFRALGGGWESATDEPSLSMIF